MSAIGNLFAQDANREWERMHDPRPCDRCAKVNPCEDFATPHICDKCITDHVEDQARERGRWQGFVLLAIN